MYRCYFSDFIELFAQYKYYSYNTLEYFLVAMLPVPQNAKKRLGHYKTCVFEKDFSHSILSSEDIPASRTTVGFTFPSRSWIIFANVFDSPTLPS